MERYNYEDNVEVNDFIIKMFEDPDITNNYPNSFVTVIRLVPNFLRVRFFLQIAQMKNVIPYMIKNEFGKIIGYITLRPITQNNENVEKEIYNRIGDCINIGAFVLTGYRNKGYIKNCINNIKLDKPGIFQTQVPWIISLLEKENLKKFVINETTVFVKYF